MVGHLRIPGVVVVGQIVAAVVEVAGQTVAAVVEEAERTVAVVGEVAGQIVAVVGEVAEQTVVAEVAQIVVGEIEQADLAGVDVRMVGGQVAVEVQLLGVGVLQTAAVVELQVERAAEAVLNLLTQGWAEMKKAEPTQASKTLLAEFQRLAFQRTLESLVVPECLQTLGLKRMVLDCAT